MKKKIAIVYWTYDKDYDLIQLSLIGAKNLIERYSNIFDIDVFVYEDTNHLSNKQFPNFVKYSQTPFKRNNNLNGLECITEMLKIYYELAQTYDWIFKVDSDTYINHIDFLDDINEQIGIIGSTNEYGICMGCAVLYSSNAIKYLSTLNLTHESEKILISPKNITYKFTRICDDLIFNTCISEKFKILDIPIIFKYRKIIGVYSGILEFYTFGDYQLKNTYATPKMFQKHFAITFKCSYDRLMKSNKTNLADINQKYALENFQKYIKLLNA